MSLCINLKQSAWSLESPHPPLGPILELGLLFPGWMSTADGKKLFVFLSMIDWYFCTVASILQSFFLWCRPLQNQNVCVVDPEFRKETTDLWRTHCQNRQCCCRLVKNQLQIESLIKLKGNEDDDQYGTKYTAHQLDPGRTTNQGLAITSACG